MDRRARGMKHRQIENRTGGDGRCSTRPPCRLARYQATALQRISYTSPPGRRLAGNPPGETQSPRAAS